MREAVTGIVPRTAMISREGMTLAALAAMLLLLAVVAVGIGAVGITPPQALRIIADACGITTGGFEARQANVLLTIRLPRVLLAILIGAGLGVSGGGMQAIFRNPLADPALVGVSAGAALGAVTTIVLGKLIFGALTGAAAIFSLPVASFAGGLLATALVYRIAMRGGRASITGMLLAGIAVNAMAGALTGILTFLASDAQLRTITFWTMGSLGGASWSSLGAIAPFLLASIIIVPRLWSRLNIIALGEGEARHLGVDVERLRRWVVILVALAVGASVAVAGIIGFIGLVAPHLLRLIIGPNHRHLLPGSALLGALLLLAADLIARTAVIPAELPIGAVTALLGAPMFIWLLVRERREEG